MFELVYTSVPQGLLPGTRGFSTVAFTAGMPPNLIMPLENLSGYNFVFQNGTLLPELNLPCCCYIKMRFGNQTLLVASRIAPNGLDYSQRNNKIAHHWLFESPAEVAQTRSGAAGLLGSSQYFMHDFTGKPRELPFRRVPVLQPAELPAVHFQKLAGDSGWAGVIAQRFRTNPGQAFYIKYPRHTDQAELLHLVSEVSALLNNDELVDFTFSTYFIQQGSSTDCFLRMLPDFSPLLASVERFHSDSLLVLNGAQTIPAEYADQVLCHTARYGTTPVLAPGIPIAADIPQDNIQQKPLPPPLLKPTAPVCKLTAPEFQADTVPAAPTPPEKQPVHKKVILAAGGILLLASVISLLLLGYSIPEAAQVQLPEPVANPEATPESAPELPAKPQKKPEPVGSQLSLMDADVRKRAVEIDHKTGLHFFAAFTQLPSKQNHPYIMPLPEKLHNPDEIYVEMRIPGKKTLLPNNHSFIRSNPHGGVTVIEAQKGIVPHIPVRSDAIAPELTITPTADGKALQFMPAGDIQPIIPKTRNIGRFYFRSQNRVFVADCNFNADYLRHLPPGKLTLSADGIFRYQPSPLEKSLHNFIETRIGQSSVLTLCSQKLPIDQWNKATAKFCPTYHEYQEICGKISAIQKSSHLPPSSTELKEFTDKLKLNSSYANLELLCGEVDSILEHFLTVQLLNQQAASDKDIKTMIATMEKVLKQNAPKYENKKWMKKVEHQVNVWKKQHKQIQKLHSLLKEQLQYINILDSQHKDLKPIYLRILNPVKAASLDVGNRLHTILINQEDQSPRPINDKEIAELTRLMQQQLKILPSNAN